MPQRSQPAGGYPPGRANRRGAILVRCAVAAAVFVAALELLGRWLITESPLQPSGAIIVMGGGFPFRAAEAASIFHEGVAPEVWLMSHDLHEDDRLLARLGIEKQREVEQNRRVLERLGIPLTAIRIHDCEVHTTLDEIRCIARATAGFSPERFIVVTSPYHTRRVQVAWKRLMPSAHRIVIRATRTQTFDPRAWWIRPRTAVQVIAELAGITSILTLGVRGAQIGGVP